MGSNPAWAQCVFTSPGAKHIECHHLLGDCQYKTPRISTLAPCLSLASSVSSGACWEVSSTHLVSFICNLHIS